jgi:hypothetical protein
MRRIAAILLCIAMCLGMVPWVAHAEGTVQYAAVTASEPDFSDANLVSMGDPEGCGGGPGPGGDQGGGGGAEALVEYEVGANQYVVSTDCTVSPDSSVTLSNCSITVTSEGTLTVQAGASAVFKGVVFTNYGTIVIEAGPAADPPEHGRIEIRDDVYHDPNTNEDRVTEAILENYGTVNVSGILEVTDGAELVNCEGGSIVVETSLRFGPEKRRPLLRVHNRPLLVLRTATGRHFAFR